MRDPRHPGRLAKSAVARLTAILLIVSFASVALPKAAVAQAPPAQGVQFGEPVDLNVLDPATGTCKRHTEVNRLLYNQALLSRTSWIRVNLRAAGGVYHNDPNIHLACRNNVWAAYQSILNDFASRAPWVQVIGLLTHDFLYGSYSSHAAYDYAEFAHVAGNVACSLAYEHVDAWQIWNEPNIDETTTAFLPPALYARVLGLTSREIRDCGYGDRVISAGLFPTGSTATGLIEYMAQVDTAWDYYSGYYSNVAQAVDGIGVHAYIDAIALGESGHSRLQSFLSQIAAAFNRPIYITEFGWAVQGDMTPALQCHNLVNAFRVIDSWAGGSGDDRVVAATWFNLIDFPGHRFGLYEIVEQTRIVGRPALSGYLTGVCGETPAPSLLSATAVNSSSIRLTWQDNSINETGFRIHNGMGWSTDVGPNVTSYTRTGLAPGTLQCLYVGAIDNGGRVSMASTYSCATTPTPTPLGVPLNVNAVAVDANRIQISWTDNSSAEMGFAIANGTTAANVGANITTYIWAFLAPGTTMCFWVASKSSSLGQSPWSNQSCATTPG